MSQYPIDLFRTSCGAAGALELNVSGPGGASEERRVFDQPFVLVGRDERNELRLEDEAVSRRHAYLQQLGRRLFCVDLGSRTGTHWGGEARPAGWLLPDQGIQIGPFTLEHVMADRAGDILGDEVEADWDPLQDPVTDPGLPWISAERDNLVLAQMRMNRVMLLVGSSLSCRVRLLDARVSRLHCCLLKTAAGVWLIDLLGRTGTFLNDEPVRWAPVKEGDRLRVGPYVLRVWYQAADKQTPSLAQALAVPREEPSTAELPALVSALQARLDEVRERQREVEALRQQLADSQAECARLRERSHTLEVQLAKAADLQSRLDAAQVERDRLHTEKQASQQLLEQACARVTELERALAEAAKQPKIGVSERPALVHKPRQNGALPAQTLVPAIAPLPENVNESMLLPLVNQFSLMQQQMFDQFQQTLLMMAQTFGKLHQDQMDVIRQELAQIRELTRQLHALQTEGMRQTPLPQPASPQTQTATSKSKAISDAADAPVPPVRDQGDVHSWLAQRLVTLQQERQTRWQKILNLVTGK